MKSFDLAFKFKGSRDYVHGTDIFNALLKKLVDFGYAVPDRISFSMHRMMRSNLTVCLGSPDEMPEDKAAFCMLEKDSERVVLGLYENGRDVIGRYAYDEDAIVAGCVMTNSELTLKSAKRHPYTNIEKVVALNKSYMTQYFRENDGKWVFSKLQVAADFITIEPEIIRLTLISNIGVRMTRTQVRFDDKIVGEIYFSAL